MNSPLFIVLRGMRAPLIVLITSYAVSILGMVLIPGADGQGLPVRTSFFHAFYFISYTATTIGFGEVPHPFTGAQRMWVTFSLYLTVLAWFYAVGKILQLVQSPGFKQALGANAFRQSVRRLRRPFYIVCGYGETGSELVDAFDHRDIQSVVVDIDADRAAELEIADLRLDVPAHADDVRNPEVIVSAGLMQPLCIGVVALTNDDSANLAVAAAVGLLRPDLPVVCRCDAPEMARSMAALGTLRIISAFSLFGEHLATAVRSPGHYLLREWLTAAPDEPLREPLFPPSGHWVLCGYGRFGREVARGLGHHGNTLAVVESDPHAAAEAGGVCGRGTEPDVLEAAGIGRAVGLIAGTGDDITNLSIVQRALAMNPKLFVAIRQNLRRNSLLVDALRAQLVMNRAIVVVHASLAHLITPLLARFLEMATEHGNDWANEVLAGIAGVTEERVPECWTLSADALEAPALAQALATEPIPVSALLADPRNRDERLPALPLLLERGGAFQMLPDEGHLLRPNDRLLFCGRGRARRAQQLTASNDNVLRYVLSGRDVPGGWIWQRLAGARRG